MKVVLASTARKRQGTPYGYSPIHFAVLNKNVPLEVMSFLIDKGANVNGRDFRLRNPLLYLLSIASNNNHTLETSKLMPDRGIHIDAVDIRGCTKLHIGLSNPFGKDLIELLVNRDASIRSFKRSCYVLYLPHS